MSEAVEVLSEGSPMMEVRDLERIFVSGGRLGFRRRRRCHAVDGVSFVIQPRETFALVGESGCGKSTLGKLVLRLLSATSGSLLFDGRDLAEWSEKDLRRRAQLVFQDSLGALDPRLSALAQVAEPLDIHGIGNRSERRHRARQMLLEVGLESDLHERLPHQLSGGQQQRAVIARALVLRPDFVVCDEPVSALDVSIQAQVINLLQDLQARYGLTYLFISHDLAVVRHSADRIGVMYLGCLMELASADRIFDQPMHPYTKALIAAVPIPDPRRRRLKPVLRGDPPSPFDPPPGCRFQSRCPHVQQRCREEAPGLRPVAQDHAVACHFAEQLA